MTYHHVGEAPVMTRVHSYLAPSLIVLGALLLVAYVGMAIRWPDMPRTLRVPIVGGAAVALLAAVTPFTGRG
jgi:hypothetical protein